MLVKNDRYEILTSEGFRDFSGLKISSQKTKSYNFHDGSYIRVTDDHLFLKDGDFIEANKLKIGDEISGKIILSIEPYEEELVVDPINVKSSDSSYIANDVVNHNCLLLDECVTGDTEITLRNKKTGVIERKSIEDHLTTVGPELLITKNKEFEVLTEEGFKDFTGIKKTLTSSISSIFFSKESDFLLASRSL